jgi:hypothetical protein
LTSGCRESIATPGTESSWRLPPSTPFSIDFARASKRPTPAIGSQTKKSVLQEQAAAFQAYGAALRFEGAC